MRFWPLKITSEKLYFSSDPHYFHKNILKYCHRPFADAPEMDNELVRLWNETVPVDGTVCLLGDLAMGGAKPLLPIIKRLNGRKFLVPGNHDNRLFDNKEFCAQFELIQHLIELQV